MFSINYTFYYFLYIRSFIRNAGGLPASMLTRSQIKKECILFYKLFNVLQFNKDDKKLLSFFPDRSTIEGFAVDETKNSFNYRAFFSVNNNSFHITIKSKKIPFFGLLSKVLSGTFLHYFLFDINLGVMDFNKPKLNGSTLILNFTIIDIIGLVNIMTNKNIDPEDRKSHASTLFENNFNWIENVVNDFSKKSEEIK